jgi:glycosyltransferase involved in cell wall biosynthesis
MRILIDLQGAQTESRFRGIGRYSLSIAEAIVKEAVGHEVLLVLNLRFPESIPIIRAKFEKLIPESCIRIYDVPITSEYEQWSSLASEIVREQFIASLKPDIVLITSIFEGYLAPAVTSVGLLKSNFLTAAILYDLIPLLNQEQYFKSENYINFYRRKIEWLKRSSVLLSISESSRLEAIDNLGIASDQVVNISTAVSSEFQQQKLNKEAWKAICKQIGIQRKFVMYAPGGFDPRKNFERLIAAYGQLPVFAKANYQLLIVSKLNFNERQELELLREQHKLSPIDVLLPGYVEEKTLLALYSKADLFVFPSLHEGFGLPVLEAMSCGAPVIGSNCTSVPEVIGRDDALFDPKSADSIRNKMLEVLMDDKFRNDLRFHAQQQAKKFSWTTTAKKVIQTFERLNEFAQKQKEKLIEDPKKSEVAGLANLSRLVAPSDVDLRLTAICMAFNAGSERQQLLLDISSLVHSDAKSGIQRVVRSLLTEFLRNPPPNYDIKPIWFHAGVYRYANNFISKLTKSPDRSDDYVVDFMQGDIYLCLDLIMHLTPQVHEVHLDLAARGLKIYFIVYDILLVNHPEWWPAGMEKEFKNWLRSICEVSTGLICISEAVASDLRNWIEKNPPRRLGVEPIINNFHLGADLENSLPSKGIPESSSDVLAKIGKRLTFLMVSTIEPRKAYAQALDAFELLWQQGLDVNLVIVGKRGWLVDDLIQRLLIHKENGNRIFWLEGISDEYLDLVYAQSDCLLAASYGEGFGLPLIEAAQHKLPVIARDIPVFKEIAGANAYYFKANYQCEDLANELMTWISLYENDQHPRSEKMNWLTWSDSAKKLTELIL